MRLLGCTVTRLWSIVWLKLLEFDWDVILLLFRRDHILDATWLRLLDGQTFIDGEIAKSFARERAHQLLLRRACDVAWFMLGHLASAFAMSRGLAGLLWQRLVGDLLLRHGLFAVSGILDYRWMSSLYPIREWCRTFKVNLGLKFQWCGPQFEFHFELYQLHFLI